MSFFEHQRWLVSTLSSVHLGTGQDYESTSYVVDDGVMYVFSESALFKALKPNQIKQISDFAEKGERGLVSIQKLLREQREELKQYSEQVIAIGAGVERFYDKRMNEDGKNFNQMLLPKTASEMYSGKPFIPGTAIKGAIRTALMNAKLNQNPRLNPEGERQAHKILAKIHEFRQVTEDPFKSIKVADATGCSENLYKKIVLVNSQHWDDAKKSKAARPSLLESIAPGQIQGLYTDLRLWPLEKGQKQPVNDFADLAKQVNQYFFKQLKEELNRNQLAGYYRLVYIKALNALVNDEHFNQALNDGNAMILRLGKFSGAVSKTLDAVRSIKILGQKGAPNKFKALPNEQRVVASQENGSNDCEPLGWVVLTREGVELDALRVFSSCIYAHDEQMQKLSAAINSLEEKREASKAKAAAKVAAEAHAAAIEAEKAHRMSAMSEAERSIHQLLVKVERGEGKGAGAGHQLWSETKVLIAACQPWSEVDKRALLDAAKKIALHLGIDWKKNDKAKAVIRSIGVVE